MKKKALSLLLACTMAFSSFSMALAAGDAVVVEATQSNEQMAGDFLKAAGVLKGDDKGNLNLDQALTREQAMLMIAKLMGKEDEALNFKGQSTFKDAKNNAYWAPVIAWAEAQKLTNGMGDGTFGLGKEATKNQVVTMYLRVLGYEVTWAGKELSADSQKVVEETGLLTAVGETFNRGAMAVMTVNTLKATPKGAETTLAKNLNVDMTKAPKFVTPSVPGEIGEAKVTSVKAVANDKIEVKFDKDVTVSAANFKVTEKADATKAIEVKELTAESTKVVVLTVEGLTSGKAYTVKIADQSMNFTGVAKSTIAPTVVNAKGTDFNRVEIEFKSPVDKATAETVANYTVEKATVVKATLNADRNVVTLETEGLVKNTLYKVTIENVKSVDAVAMKKVVKSFRAIEDTITPKVLSSTPINNEMYEIKFSKEMDKATLENVENYKFTSTTGNLDIVSVTVDKSASDKSNDVVRIKTSTMDVKATYTLTVEGLKDASVKGNALAKVTRTFRGLAVDNIAPVVFGNPVAVNNTQVEVIVRESNLLDPASVQDVSNYAFDRNLQVVSVELDADSNKYGKDKTILITTSAQEKGNYKLTVKGIMDEFGNALKPLSGTNYRQYGFQWKDVVKAAPAVESIKSNGLNTVVVKFTEKVNKATAQDPTNYVLNGDLGAATKAKLESDGFTVTLTTTTQVAGKSYELTINGVEHKYAAIPMADVKAKFIATATEADLTAPTLSYVYAPNSREVVMAFSEPVQAPTGVTFKAGTLDLSFAERTGDGEILVFKTNTTMEAINYTLTKTAVVVKDIAGNPFELGSSESFGGTTIASEGPTTTVGDIEQVNVKTIKVTFNRNVKFDAGTKIGDLTVAYDGTKKNVILLQSASAMDSGKKFTFNFAAIKDNLDVASTSKELVFTTYMTVGDAPVMTNATAIDNKTVELTFSEPLLAAGTYTIETTKEDGTADKTYSVVKYDHDSESDKVTITLNKEMDGNQIYTLKYSSAARNLAGKPAVTKDFSIQFNGSDVKPNKEYITVKVINSKEIVVYDQAAAKVKATAVYLMDGDSTTGASILAGTTTTDAAILTSHLLTGSKYQVQVGSLKVVIDGVLAPEVDSATTIQVTPATITRGANSVVTVSGLNFKSGLTIGDFTITPGVTASLTTATATTATLSVNAPTAGSITIQANRTAFNPTTALDSNVVSVTVELSAAEQLAETAVTSYEALQLTSDALIKTAVDSKNGAKEGADAAVAALPAGAIKTAFEGRIAAKNTAITTAATVATVEVANKTIAKAHNSTTTAAVVLKNAAGVELTTAAGAVAYAWTVESVAQGTGATAVDATTAMLVLTNNNQKTVTATVTNSPDGVDAGDNWTIKVVATQNGHGVNATATVTAE